MKTISCFVCLFAWFWIAFESDWPFWLRNAFSISALALMALLVFSLLDKKS